MAIGESVSCQRALSVSPLPDQGQPANIESSQMEPLSLSRYLQPVAAVSSSYHSISHDGTASHSVQSRAASSGSITSPLTKDGTVGAVGKLPLPDRMKELMKGKAAINVINMGFPAEDVEAVIQLTAIETGGSYDSTNALLDAVFAYQISKTNHENVKENMNVNTSAPTLNATDEAVQKVSTETSNLENSSEEKYLIQEKKVSKKRKTKGSRTKGQTLTDGGQMEKISENLSTEAYGSTENYGPTSLMQEFSALDLKEANKQMKSSRLCKICQENEISMVLLPCGHLIACSECISLMASCTLCNKVVKGSVKVFLA